MERLKAQLDRLIDRLSDGEQLRLRLMELISIYPFSEYEYIISHLLSAGRLSIEEYYELSTLFPKFGRTFLLDFNRFKRYFANP